MGRWINRDPIHDLGFAYSYGYLSDEEEPAHYEVVYQFLNNNTLNLVDVLGLSSLPSYDNLERNFPAMSVADVLDLIGGYVKLNNFENACALRLSRALNYSGAPIPFIQPRIVNGIKRHETVSGADKKWYIFRVETMKSHLGAADLTIKPREKSKICGKKGIIIFDVSGWSDATGHADLWDGTTQTCAWECYFDKSSSIHFWETK